MAKHYLLIVALFCLHVLINSYNLCGDWIHYKDIKCVKVIKVKTTAEEALIRCHKLDETSTLVTINDQDEQDFMNRILEEHRNFSTNAWIGMKYGGKEDEGYLNSSRFSPYTSSGNNIKDSDEGCVQMSLASDIYGKWFDEFCNKTALVVCQRPQEFNLNMLKSVIKNLINEFNHLKFESNNLGAKYMPLTRVLEKRNKELTEEMSSMKTFFKSLAQSLEKRNTEMQDEMIAFKANYKEFTLANDKRVKQLQDEISSLKENSQSLEKKNKELDSEKRKFIEEITPYKLSKDLAQISEEKIKQLQNQINSVKEKDQIPLRFIYTQYPDQLAPQEIWPSMKWVEVTAQYAGLFFRAEGSGSEEFGQIQAASQSRITSFHTISAKFESWEGNNIHRTDKDYIINDNGWSEEMAPGVGNAMFGMKVFSNHSENRPRNTAIRIWKRI